MGWLLLTILLGVNSVSDDWQIVKYALLPSLNNIPLKVSGDTIAVVPLGENPYNWVLLPILEEYLTEKGGVVTPSANVRLRFHPVYLHIEKRLTGLTHTTVQRSLEIKLWISYQTNSGTRYWILSGKYNDVFPISLASMTYVEGLSPEVKKETSFVIQLLSALFLAGMLYFIYSGGQ